MTLTDELKQQAESLGFCAVGIALTQNVAAYEEKFGVMISAEDRAASGHRIGFDVAPDARPKLS